MSRSGSIFIVDDDIFVLESITTLLKAYGFRITPFNSPVVALEEFIEFPPDLLLTDINMPEMTGIELLEKIRMIDSKTPVILMTAFADLDTAVKAVQKGAFDFILKPYTPPYLLHTLDRGLDFVRLRRLEDNYKKELENTVRLRTTELNSALGRISLMNREIIERLTIAAELRDEDTGAHIKRIGEYAALMARELSYNEEEVELIRLSATMHDIGKIGVPDAILNKPGALTPEEFNIIKTHAAIGEKILRESEHPLLQMGACIAISHHERWDGSGYPFGLKGEEIPLPGRIVMLVDQYDALRSRRIYKEPFDHETTVRIILQGDGRTSPSHFDPSIYKIFRDMHQVFSDIFNESCES